MDTIKDLGELALGSRLKRLSENIMKSGQKIYQAYDISFDPKWFPVYYSISMKEDITVMEIADQLGLKHPSVSQVIKELLAKDLIATKNNPEDARKRHFSLTTKGKELQPKLEPIWKDLSNALNGLMKDHQHHMLSALDLCEQDLESQPLIDRVAQERKKRLLAQIEIVPYSEELAHHFKSLNEEWITKHFVLEDEDKAVLNNPYSYIIAAGGEIIFAKYKDQIVGTCALIKHDVTVYELAKMAVTGQCQGLQIGKKLGENIISIARQRRATSILLETNKKLSPAIALYKKLGFQRDNQCNDQSVYERCDLQMVLVL